MINFLIKKWKKTNILKRKTKNNQYIYAVKLEYETKGAIKKEMITIRIQPKQVKWLAYEVYQTIYEDIFNRLDKALQMR